MKVSSVVTFSLTASTAEDVIRERQYKSQILNSLINAVKTEEGHFQILDFRIKSLQIFLLLL